ncbi:MAG: type II secretion system minor pseudopilin GspK, partial [Pseudomonadota bacterium]
MSPRSQRERGAALVTVLMIVAMISVVSIGMVTAVTQSTNRARTLDTQAQIRAWSAAAEAVAKIQINQVLTELQGRLTAPILASAGAQTYPIEGGIISLRLRDAGNCFDLNSLSEVASGEADGAISPGLVQYQDLLSRIELPEGDPRSLSAALADWIDTDQIPRSGGAEDAYYSSERPSYRTASQGLTSVSELRSIRGYTPAIVSLLDPLVCAHPSFATKAIGAFNLNTLEEAEAPLLASVFKGALTVEAARSVIASRPAEGWQDLEAFLNEPMVGSLSLDTIDTGRLSFVTSHVEVFADVDYRGEVMTLRYLFEAVPGQ